MSDDGPRPFFGALSAIVMQALDRIGHWRLMNFLHNSDRFELWWRS